MAVIIIALLYLANFSVAIVGVIIVAALYHFYMVDWINLKSGFTQPLLYLQWYFFNNINYQTPEGIHLGGIRVHYKLSQSHKNNDTTNVNGITLSILNFLERTYHTERDTHVYVLFGGASILGLDNNEGGKAHGRGGAHISSGAWTYGLGGVQQVLLHEIGHCIGIGTKDDANHSSGNLEYTIPEYYNPDSKSYMSKLTGNAEKYFNEELESMWAPEDSIYTTNVNDPDDKRVYYSMAARLHIKYSVAGEMPDWMESEADDGKLYKSL